MEYGEIFNTGDTAVILSTFLKILVFSLCPRMPPKANLFKNTFFLDRL